MKTIAAFTLSLILLALVLASLPVDAAPLKTLKRERLTVTTAGSTGSASGSATTSAIVRGEIMRIDVDYGSLTTTTDITITQANELVSAPIVAKQNSATDATYYPSVILTDNGATSRTFDGTRPVVRPFPVNDLLSVSVAQTTAATPAITIDVYWEE